MHKQLEAKVRYAIFAMDLAGKPYKPASSNKGGVAGYKALCDPVGVPFVSQISLRRVIRRAAMRGVYLPFGEKEKLKMRKERDGRPGWSRREVAVLPSWRYDDALFKHPLPRKFRKHPRQRARASTHRKRR